ncbi:histidine kinase [Paenibacillus alginolyticus]|uniref:Histidine kinase n=1 Tax=Paenibacillus alginolyticus TaxID=59839 RepID=A0ABT4G5I3_9BACL|nr:histidine kinase [Paenibacillus alginolyticus]MCY9665345.1 histidine kinase [Paenibacillus alginolyticus]MCY9691433.1 histidine kinase [Paenibacillus alginolyticus]MEC0146541.1 histidine kinase [Paenibacillus alginolyticus]
MGLRLPHIAWNSIRFKLVAGLLFVTVPLITLLIYNNFYSIHVVHNQVALSIKNLISLYEGQIDTQLQDADRNLISLVTSDNDIRSMNTPNSEDEYQLAKHSVSDKLTNNIILYKSVDAFFVYSQSRQDLLDVFKASVTFQERDHVEQYLHRLLSERPNLAEIRGSGWFVQKIGQDYYMLRVIQSDDLYIGAWVNAKTLLMPLNLINLGSEGSALFVTNQGELMVSTNPLADENIDFSKSFQQFYISGSKNNLLIVGEPSQKGDFNLVAVIPDKQILQNLPSLTRIIELISLASIVLIPISLFFLRHILLVPLKRMIAVMRRINDGNVNVRIESYPASDEFLLVNQTFNRMMSQIEELKINVYEEQLSKHKVELQHLQLQINPHFFMNSLNILFNLAQVKNYELIQEMTLCLVQYFRFMFRSNLTFVTLREELQHVRNYIRIQELRFPNSLTCTIDSPDFLVNIPIPPLVIQTFLENSIKHSVTLDKPVHISVAIDLLETGLEPYIEIIIRDTGKGFLEDVLAEIRSGNRVVDEQGEHIGIWNVRKRLQLLYGEHAAISCYNGFPSGAVIEIKLPYQSER